MGLPVFKSFLWVSIEKLAVLGIQFIGTMILARLIGPSEFGMIGILTVFIAIANMLTDSGMGGSLVRETSVCSADFHTLFIYNGVVSLIAYILLFISAPYIAQFYHIEELCDILRVLGLSIIFTSLSITQSIHLLRSLQFKKMTICATISSLLSTITAIIMAYCGLGVWALVAQTVGYSIFYTTSLFIVAKYVPRLVFDRQSFRRQFSYGINILGANIINTIQSNISSSIVGKFYSLTSTGLYTQAHRLQGLPNNIMVSIIDKAAFPIISKHNDTNKKVEVAYAIGRYIYLLAFPLWGFCIIMAEPLVRLILGESWLDSAWIFSLLCCGGPFYTIKSISRSIFKSTGDTKVIFRIDTISSLFGITVMIIAGLISMKFLVLSVIVTAFFSMAYYIVAIKKYYGYGIVKQVLSILSPTISPIISSLALIYLVNNFLFFSHSFLGICVSLVLYAVLCISLYICLGYRELISLLNKLFKK